MRVVPRPVVGQIEFFRARLALWAANAAALGISPTAVAALAGLVGTAGEDYDAHVVARDSSRSATAKMNDSVGLMYRAGADLIKQIRVTAAAGGDEVYTLANIPVPSAPSPLPAPGTPTDFTVELVQDGALKLGWKCVNPENASGTMYEVRRRVGPAGHFAYVGGTGVRSFTDDTLPAGSTSVTYQVTAVRSTKRGNPAQFTVNFGVSGTGEAFAAVVGGAKLAA